MKTSVTKPGKAVRKKLRPGGVVLQLCLLAMAAIQLYPLIWLVFFSFKDNIEIYSGNIMGIPKSGILRTTPRRLQTRTWGSISSIVFWLPP